MPDNETPLLEKQYKLAIDARDKLNDSFHKWMTYYYVANGAILVAITSIFSKDHTDKGILVLSLIAAFVCILWNLSCKGYYYWSKSWIKIIIALERRVTKEDEKLGVYSVFSREVADKEDNPWLPNKPANISTPKLTLIFSSFSIFCWTIFAGWEFHILYPSLPICLKLLVLILVLTFIIVVYFIVLPKGAKSRTDNSHALV